MLIPMFAAQLPVLLVCAIAGVVILINWSKGSSGSIWALLGFGIAGILCFAIPILQMGVQSWIMHSGHVADRMYALAAISIFWSGLRAVSYVLLLVAVFAGRPASRPSVS